jgi:hypothetical protein
MQSTTETVRTRKTHFRKTIKQKGKVKTVERVRIKRDSRRTTSYRKPQGVILYRGPSLLDGKPIVCIATGLARASKNDKTGRFIQTYILADGPERPTDAIKSGADESVCGDCPHRAGSCYVNAGRAPNAVFDGLRRGKYPAFHPERHLRLFQGRLLRLGAYGDPAAVPLEVWDSVTSVAKHWTGYTHQWRNCPVGYSRYCMASVETPNQAREAWAAGWRTFRVRLADQPVESGEVICPASEEAGKHKTCADCRACSGTKLGGRNASPVIIVHGLHWKVASYRRTLDRIEQEEGKSGRVSLTLVN